MTIFFKAAYEVVALPLAFYAAHTLQIPKTSDENRFKTVDGYRSISLCNVYYMIFAKILSRRLQLITSLVGAYQSCGIRGRSIDTNIHIARSKLECVSEERGQVELVQIDLANVLDRVRHVLFSVLEHVGIVDILPKGIKLCYNKFKTKLINYHKTNYLHYYLAYISNRFALVLFRIEM